MKKFTKALSGLLMATMLIFALASCGDNGGEQD